MDLIFKDQMIGNIVKIILKAISIKSLIGILQSIIAFMIKKYNLLQLTLLIQT